MRSSWGPIRWSIWTVRSSANRMMPTHAEEITRKLFSKPHKVITGLALVCIEKNIEIVEADTTIVYPRQLTEAQIADHITNGQWQGKAGAYGIQETGDEFVDHIDGSFTNVMGLPMERVRRLLEQLGIVPTTARQHEPPDCETL